MIKKNIKEITVTLEKQQHKIIDICFKKYKWDQKSYAMVKQLLLKVHFKKKQYK